MKLMTSVFSILLCLSGPAMAAPQDVAGWQNYTWGMTGDQIKKIGGDEIKQQERWWPPQRQFYVDFKVPSLHLQDMDFTVQLRMDPKTEKLSDILISDAAPASSHVAPQRDEFDKLEALLTQKYGPAQLRTDLDERRGSLFPSVTFTRTWAFPTTSIELRHDWFQAAPNSSLGSITIRYFPTKSSDSSKL